MLDAADRESIQAHVDTLDREEGGPLLNTFGEPAMTHPIERTTHATHDHIL